MSGDTRLGSGAAQTRAKNNVLLKLDRDSNSSSANISLNLSRTGSHTRIYSILNCSLVARVEIAINNALSALFLFFVFVLPCK